MIGKINSTAFKGKISVIAGKDMNKDSGKAYIFGQQREEIDTKNIGKISQFEKMGYTQISIKGSDFYNYYVSTDVASTADILAAYTAACADKNVVVSLEDKRIK